MSLIIEQYGKKYEFRGIYGHPTEGVHYLELDGTIAVEKSFTGGFTAPRIRAIVHPVPNTVTLGGIVWEEGESRYPDDGEWYLDVTGHPRLLSQTNSTLTTYTILRPLSVVPEKEQPAEPVGGTP